MRETALQITLIALLALFGAVGIYAMIPEDELDTQVVTVDQYEQVRNRLYDAALDLLLEIENADNGDWQCIDEYHRNIIKTYRVPSLHILLEAIQQIEDTEFVELADAYDWTLCEYDEALREYNKIVGIK